MDSLFASLAPDAPADAAAAANGMTCASKQDWSVLHGQAAREADHPCRLWQGSICLPDKGREVEKHTLVSEAHLLVNLYE